MVKGCEEMAMNTHTTAYARWIIDEMVGDKPPARHVREMDAAAALVCETSDPGINADLARVSPAVAAPSGL